MPKVDPTTKKSWVRVLPSEIDPTAGLALREVNPQPTEKRARRPPSPKRRPPNPITGPPTPITRPPNPITRPPTPITRPPNPITRPPTPKPDYEDQEFDPYVRGGAPMRGPGAYSDADYGQRQAGQREPWLNTGGSNVQPLDASNFYDAIVRMEKALVMFYNPSSRDDSIWARKEFSEAANKPHPRNHAFVSVDCSTNSDLCCREQAPTGLPIFKLYSNGYVVSSNQHSYDLTANQMLTLLRMAPVLNQPKNNPPRQRLMSTHYSR